MTNCKTNTDCEHLCLLTPYGGMCACSNGYQLASNNRSCNGMAKKSFHVLSLANAKTICYFFCFFAYPFILFVSYLVVFVHKEVVKDGIGLYCTLCEPHPFPCSSCFPHLEVLVR